MERIDCVQHEPEDRVWVGYGSGPGVKVFGNPSKGDVYVLDSWFGVELDFLGLNRFNNTEHPSKFEPDWQAKEDAHCNQSQLLYSFPLTSPFSFFVFSFV